VTPEQLLAAYGPRESMEYDVVVVGAGPGGLAAAIRLKQLAAESGREVSVCVLEKGSEPGAHILSGAIMDPRALSELIPDWKDRGAPLNQPVTRDEILFLGEQRAFATPQFFIPASLNNHGNYIVAGWRNRPKPWAWRFSPDSRRRKCCMPITARSRASRPGIWG